MSLHYFLLTYTVSPTDTSSETKKKLANKVRDKIADIDVGWTKSETVETVFSGILTLTKSFKFDKREEVKELVRATFDKVVVDCEANRRSVQINFSIMVEELDSAFEFDLYS